MINQGENQKEVSDSSTNEEYHKKIDPDEFARQLREERKKREKTERVFKNITEQVEKRKS